ncbi:thermonuclease family protein [Pseudorhodoferax sp.]|uniref:thermonuclease family protein n=1 Tax=Pseudorhodoferax sp. TaxID=1993553 RepID=UPI0039E4F21C
MSLRSRVLWLLCLAVLSWAWPAAAAERGRAAWPGQVSHVSDGDTLWVRPAAGGAPRKIRLHGIDAPEHCQAHGEAARSALARQALGQPVRVQGLRRDNYGRLLARVWLHGQDLGALQVRAGHAWSYRYRHNPGPYVREEQAARAAARGLFARADAVRPYTFRRRHGPCAH